jgi:hypothetical protein
MMQLANTSDHSYAVLVAVGTKAVAGVDAAGGYSSPASDLERPRNSVCI